MRLAEFIAPMPTQCTTEDHSAIVFCNSRDGDGCKFITNGKGDASLIQGCSVTCSLCAPICSIQDETPKWFPHTHIAMEGLIKHLNKRNGDDT